ncbi:hypothetical protein INT44_002508 [Umbelopsis vinacea]|uniref:Uncharacterized protein n=1 Tax=Umbelopsis vinacea TaxID=44442 RepID=A0A8H7U9L5_9FUNG|nr:hypothetical protein INT44_002508 [Umbelopsis vinacea]
MNSTSPSRTARTISLAKSAPDRRFDRHGCNDQRQRIRLTDEHRAVVIPARRQVKFDYAGDHRGRRAVRLRRALFVLHQLVERRAGEDARRVVHAQPDPVHVLERTLAVSLRLEREGERLQIGGDRQADGRDVRGVLQRDRTVADDLLRMHGAVGQNADRFAFQVIEPAHGRHLVTGCQHAGVHEETVADLRVVDGPVDDRVEHGFSAFRHHAHGLETAVRIVVMPCRYLVRGRIGQTEQRTVRRHAPHDRVGRLRVRHIDDGEEVEQVRRHQADVLRDVAASVIVVRHLADVTAERHRIEQRVADRYRHHVGRAGVALRLHGQRARRQRLSCRPVGGDSPFRARREQHKLGQWHDVADRVRFARCDAKHQRVSVARRRAGGQVRLGAGARHPHCLRQCDRAGEHAALLVVADRARVVVRTGEWIGQIGRRGAGIRNDIVVDHRRADGLADKRIAALEIAVDVVARRARDCGPADRVHEARERQVVNAVRVGRRQRLFAGCEQRRHYVVVLHVVRCAGRAARVDRGYAGGRRRARHEADRGQRPVRRSKPAQLHRRIVLMHDRHDVRGLHIVQIEQIGFEIWCRDLVDRRAVGGQEGLPVRVEPDVVDAEFQRHSLRDAVRERDQPRARGAVLCLEHERRARAVHCGAVRQRDEVAAQRKPGLELVEIDAAEQFRRDLAGRERAKQVLDVRHYRFWIQGLRHRLRHGHAGVALDHWPGQICGQQPRNCINELRAELGGVRDRRDVADLRELQIRVDDGRAVGARLKLVRHGRHREGIVLPVTTALVDRVERRRVRVDQIDDVPAVAGKLVHEQKAGRRSITEQREIRALRRETPLVRFEREVARDGIEAGAVLSLGAAFRWTDARHRSAVAKVPKRQIADIDFTRHVVPLK